MLDSGECVTHAVPIYEGYALPHAILRMDVGGCDLDFSMCRELNERGYNFTTSAEREIVKKMKERLCCLSLERFSYNPPKDLCGYEHEKQYELPDGKVITSTLIDNRQLFLSAMPLRAKLYHLQR